jgi:hypothetical protein
LRISETQVPWTAVPLDQARVVTSQSLDSTLNAATDKLLQWPIFERLLSSLPRSTYLDFHGREIVTYLDDVSILADTPARQSLPELLQRSIDLVHISTEECDIERLVAQFFRRVNTKNPIISRRVARRYCQRYYGEGPSFTLETCIVLLMCALGAISTDFDPSDAAQTPSSPFQQSTRSEALCLGCSYFVAAEQRLGAAMSVGSTLATQCLCLTG